MKDEVKKELLALSESAPNGLLQAEEVVEYAKRNPKSALRAEFEWDDKKAAHEFRVSQARELIRAYVTVLPQTLQKVRGFLSVPTDRTNGGGYRQSDDVLKDDALRRQMVEDFLKRLEGFQTQVALLPELAPLVNELMVMIAKYRAGIATAMAA